MPHDTSAGVRRPPYGPIATLLLAVLLGLLLFAAQIFVIGVVLSRRVGGKFTPAQFSEAGARGDVLSLAIVAAALLVSAAILALVALRRGPSIADYLALGKPSRRSLAFGAGLACALAVFGDTWLTLLGRPVVHPSMRHALDTAGSRWPVLAFSAVVAAPLSEELLFRGFVYRGWQRLPPWLLALGTALPWAAMHVQYGLIELFTIAVTGVVLAELRRRSGSLWPALLCHSVLNLIASLETRFL